MTVKVAMPALSAFAFVLTATLPASAGDRLAAVSSCGRPEVAAHASRPAGISEPGRACMVVKGGFTPRADVPPANFTRIHSCSGPAAQGLQVASVEE
jgi:hypothetical protein